MNFREILFGRGVSVKNVDSPKREGETEHTAERGKEKALHEKLAEDARAAGSECGANSKLTSTDRGTREEQVGDVRADHQEKQASHTRKHQEGSPHVPGALILQRNEPDAHARVGVWVLRCQMLRDDFHFRLSLWQRHTRFEPGDNAEKMAAVVGELLLRKRKRNIELVVWIGKAKSLRHDANNRVALFVQANGAANHVGIGGEAVGPKTVAEQGDMSGAGAIFFDSKCATEHWIGLQDRKNVSGEGFAFDAHGLAGPCQVPASIADGCHATEGPVAILPVREISGRRGVLIVLVVREMNVLPNHRELLRIRKGQRTQKDCLHDAKNRGVCADA